MEVSEMKKPSRKKDDSWSDLMTALVAMALCQAVAYPLGLSGTAAFAMGINVVAWVPSALAKNERFYDFTGMCGFIILSLRSQFRHMDGDSTRIGDAAARAAAAGGFPRCAVATGLVLVWTLRLGIFLFQRICRDGHDQRFNGVRDRPFKFLMFWAIQGLWVFLTPLPMFALHSRDARDVPGGLGPREALGLSVWAVGFVLEVVADEQKRAFKANPANAGRFIDVGLWSRCRHPNYLGEMVIWVGFFIFCSRGLLEGSGWITLTGPAFVIALVGFLSTSVLEKASDKKYGHRPGYDEYKKTTPCFALRLW